MSEKYKMKGSFEQGFIEEGIRIKELIFYRSGAMVRDLGLIYFYNILKNKKDKDIEVELTANYLKINNLDEQKLYDLIINEGVYRVFLKGVVAELKKKMDEKDAQKLVKGIEMNAFLEEFGRRLDNREDIKEKSKDSIKSKINKSFQSKYFPYVRNSPKYGYNAQSEENFHNNLKELVRLVIELNAKDEEEQLEVLKDYEPIERQCTVCHIYKPTRFDITHKDEKKERVSCKYDYLFMGSQGNTYSNYFKGQSSVCFVCEWMSLISMLYFSLESPSTIAYTNNLITLDFINSKVMLKERIYRDKGLYRYLAKYRNQKIQLYETSIDANTGVILNFIDNLRLEELLEDIKLYDLVDRFHISQDRAKKVEIVKEFIKNKNRITVERLLLNELLVIENVNGSRSLDLNASKENIQLYLALLEYNHIDKGGGRKMRNQELKELGIKLGKKMGEQNKKRVSFRLIQMMKSENREDIFRDMTHIIVANQVNMPQNLSEIIMHSEVKELHYQIGGFLEGLINTKMLKGEEDNE